MNYADTTIRHGEMMLVPITEIDGLETIEESKRIILAHSETGHHHVAVGDVVKYKAIAKGHPLYEQIVASLNYSDGDNVPTEFQPFRAKSTSVLEHLKSHDKHETKTILPGLYIVPSKTEYDPFAKIIQAVRD